MAVIAKRERDPRLQKLFDEDKNVYSISKLNTIDDCQHEAYWTYAKGEKGINGIYGIMGTKIHDKLDEIVNNKAIEKDLLPVLNEELSDLTMLGIDFPKDRQGGTSIRDNWIASMKHFCTNFVKPKGKFTTEEFIIYKINEDRYLQGYIDLIRHNKDGTISIYDWKTSTDFNKEDLIHHGRQLIFYAIAKEQEGYIVKEVAWIMLKYCEVAFEGKARVNSKNKTQLVKIINRGKLLSELKQHIESDLDEFGFDELEIEIMLKNAVDSNSFDGLPEEIKQKYIIKPYVRKYELTDELRQETLDYIKAMADLFESKSDDEKDWPPRKFTKTSKTGKENDDSFKCNVLCNHRNTCIHIKRYNELRLLTKTNDEDLF